MPESRRRIGQFVHIEKTAGTSVRYATEQAVGAEHVAIYSPEADRLAPSSEGLMPATTPLLDRIRMSFSNPVLGPMLVILYPMISGVYRERIRRRHPTLEIPEGTNVIFGHFAADKFDGMLNQEPIRGIIIRDPLDRMRSHYDHWKRNRGYEDWRVHIPFRRGMTFEEFAMLPQLQNYQTQALAGKDISTFDVVGVTEHTEEFTEAFLQRLAQEGLTLPDHMSNFEQRRLNITPQRQRSSTEGLSLEFLQAFQEFHAQDYVLYEQARTIQEQRMSQGNESNYKLRFAILILLIYVRIFQ